MGIGIAIKRLGNKETIEDDNEIIMFDPVLVQALVNIENSDLIKEVKKGANSAKGGKSSSLKKYKTPEVEIIEQGKTNVNKRSLEDMTNILSRKEEKEL